MLKFKGVGTDATIDGEYPIQLGTVFNEIVHIYRLGQVITLTKAEAIAIQSYLNTIIPSLKETV